MIEMKPGDWGVLFVCLSLIPLTWFAGGRETDTATSVSIVVNEQLEGIYPIYRDKTINIEHGKAVIDIKNGKVRVASSSCRSKICVLSGWHDHGGDHIICLPNRIVVSLHSTNNRYDAINF